MGRKRKLGRDRDDVVVTIQALKESPPGVSGATSGLVKHLVTEMRRCNYSSEHWEIVVDYSNQADMTVCVGRLERRLEPCAEGFLVRNIETPPGVIDRPRMIDLVSIAVVTGNVVAGPTPRDEIH